MGGVSFLKSISVSTRQFQHVLVKNKHASAILASWHKNTTVEKISKKLPWNKQVIPSLGDKQTISGWRKTGSTGVPSVLPELCNVQLFSRVGMTSGKNHEFLPHTRIQQSPESGHSTFRKTERPIRPVCANLPTAFFAQVFSCPSVSHIHQPVCHRPPRQPAYS